MEERLGEMRKERGLRKGATVSSSPQGIISLCTSIKIWFFQAYRMHYSTKDMSWCETVCKNVLLCNKLNSLS